MSNNFELLKTKEIYAILDGDAILGKLELQNGETIDVSMPHLTGSQLCSISTKFGLPARYTWGGTNKSRWMYVDELFSHCINKNRVSELLSYLFRKEAFVESLLGKNEEDVDYIYLGTVQKAIEEINKILYFGNHELVVVAQKFLIREKGANVKVETPQIKRVTRNYIKDISARALDDVEQGFFDSAITKSRTLLEETFFYVLEKRKIEPCSSGDIGTLYKQVKDAFSMHADKNTDKRMNTMLSGLEKIVSGIAEMRNKDSDAHGVGSNRVDISDYHARLFVNSAMTMADFILSVSEQ